MKSFKKIALGLLGFVILFGGRMVWAQVQTDVLHYGINLDVNHQIHGQHIGHTDIKFLCLNSGDMVEFMLKDQEVDSVKMNGYNLEYQYVSPKISINIGQHNLGDTLLVEVYYHGGQVVENNSMAWGGIHYGNSLIYTLGVAFMDYPHSYARSWFVVKDVFDDKATYSLNISVKSEVQAICGGVLDSVSDFEGYHTYYYTMAQPIAPYLVSMTIADFKKYCSQYNSEVYGYTMPIEVYYQNDNQQSTIENMFADLPKAIDTLERAFGRFPFNRAGYCVTPKGSMEHVDNISLAAGVLNGDISGMSNIVHELAHAWFGNLVTCESQEEMWLNEGITSFTTRLSLESIYGSEATKNYYRSIHQDVIKNVVQSEGYLPVYGIDSTLTYGSTVYDKGSLVALSLKAYLGDSLFYATMKDFLNHYAYKNITSSQLRDFFTEKTGVDLTSFFETMVFSSSTPHYEISKKEISPNEVKINILQRAYPDNSLTLSKSRIPITFMDKDFNTYKELVEFEGDSAELTFNTLPIEVQNVFLDFDEEFQDLTTDCYLITNQANKTIELPNTYFKLKTKEITDSVLVRATLHWISDTNYNLPYGVDRISGQHFWTIEGVNLQQDSLCGMFYYNASPSVFDSTLIYNSLGRDSLMLLFRPDKYSDWCLMPSNNAGSSAGYIRSDYLWQGDYVMAMGNKAMVSVEQIGDFEKDIAVYPNPNQGFCTIECRDYMDYSAELFDINGKKIKDITLTNRQTDLDYQQYKANAYIIKFTNKHTKKSQSKIIIKQ